jgi:HD-like signal output (HDOD) protein
MDDSHGQTIDNPHIDKTGAELDRQRFQMLRDIALELSGKTVFPPGFDSVMRLRRAIEEKGLGLEKAVALIAGDPLVTPCVLTLANSAVYKRAGEDVRDLHQAVERIGIAVVRSVALAIAMKQLLLARDVPGFQQQARRLWAHSLRSASVAYVIAKRLTKINPDEAMLAGLIHDIGAFYMIYRAAQYEELVLRPDTAKYLVIRWHESVGHSLALALGLPARIADALLDHDQPRPVPQPPKTLADVVYLGNLLAGGKFEWLDEPNRLGDNEVEKLESIARSLNEEIALHEASFKTTLM